MMNCYIKELRYLLNLLNPSIICIMKKIMSYPRKKFKFKFRTKTLIEKKTHSTNNFLRRINGNSCLTVHAFLVIKIEEVIVLNKERD